MKKLLAILALVFVSPGSGFTTPSITRLAIRSSTPSTTDRFIQQASTVQSRRLALSLANENNNEGGGPSVSLPKLLGPIFIALLSLSSLTNLTTRELPMIFTGQPNADYLGAVFDTLFLGWAGQTLLLQTGALADAPDDISTGVQLEGLEARINVDVGREPGTWMPQDWSASGARLVLPVKVRFTNNQMDLGIPGEDSLGGRYCRRLEVIDDSVSFVGPQGQVDVPVKDGGWATLPILNQKTQAGERKLRFFLEFPQGAERNDVSIPAGKVFFSSAVFPADAMNSDAVAGVPMIQAPDGAGILTEGGVTIKSNGGIMNLWGVAGDINLILGRYSVSEVRSD